MTKDLREGKFDDNNEDLKCFANCIWEHLGSVSFVNFFFHIQIFILK